MLGTTARRGDEPADRKRLATLGANLDRNLIGCATDAAAAHFDTRTDIVERIVEYAERLALGARFDRFERSVDDAFGGRLLAVEHDGIHEFGQHDIAELGIG